MFVAKDVAMGVEHACNVVGSCAGFGKKLHIVVDVIAQIQLNFVANAHACKLCRNLVTNGRVAVCRHILPVTRIEIGFVNRSNHLHARIMFRVDKMFCEYGTVLSPLVIVCRDKEPIA